MYLCLQRLEEGVVVPGTGVTDSCQLPHGCWQCPLEEQSVLLIAEPSLQTLMLFFFFKFDKYIQNRKVETGRSEIGGDPIGDLSR